MHLTSILIIQVFWCCVFIVKVKCDTFIWTLTANMSDPINWDSKFRPGQTNCLIMNPQNDADVVFGNMSISQIVLPKWATMFFEPDATITFEKHTSNSTCVKQHKFGNNYNTWVYYPGWVKVGELENPAIPYIFRVPLMYDQVFFPTSLFTRALILDRPIKVYDLHLFHGDQEVFASSSTSQLEITHEECKDPTGCYATMDYDGLCDFVPQNIQPECVDYIYPYGFCGQPICGAVITINTLKPGFTIQKIYESIESITSNTFATKIEGNRILIVFAETLAFTGNSLIEANQIYHTLTRDPSYFCTDIELQISGPPLHYTSARLKQLSLMTLSTLLAVVTVFLLLFALYSPQGRNITNRLFGNHSLSGYTIRYNNIEDRGYIVDDRSTAGSVMDLHRSFENPMFEQESTISKSTSVESLNSVQLQDNIPEAQDIKMSQLGEDI